jgi:hypothetical protein
MGLHMSRKIKTISVLTEDGLTPVTEGIRGKGTLFDRAKEFSAFTKKKTAPSGGGAGRNTNMTGDDEEFAGQADRVKIQETGRERVIKGVFSVESNRTRVLVWLTDADLRNEYLTQGGAQKIVDTMTDRQIDANFFENSEHKPEDQFIHVVDNFNLDSVTEFHSGTRKYCVLLNVPNTVIARANSLRNRDEARRLMGEFLNHHNYVGTLDVSAIEEADVGPLNSEKERREKFNVRKFVVAWVSNLVIAAARKEEERQDQMSDRPDDDGVVKKIVDKAVHYAITAIHHDNIFSGGARGERTKTTQFQTNLKEFLTAHADVKDNGRLIMKVKRAFAEDPDIKDLMEQEPKFAAIVQLVTGVKTGYHTPVNPGEQAAPAPAQTAAPAPAPTAAPAAAPTKPVKHDVTKQEKKSAEQIEADVGKSLTDLFSTRDDDGAMLVTPEKLGQIIGGKIINPGDLTRLIHTLQTMRSNLDKKK